MNKTLGSFIVTLGVLAAVVTVGASSYQTRLLCQKVELLENRISETSEEFDEHMEDIYLLMKMDSSRLYTIMDTEVRILHYTKPHKHATFGCSECAEQKDRGKNAQKEVQNLYRYQQGSEGIKEARLK